MARVLIVGESWVSSATHYKGFDQFSTTTFEVGVAPLKNALESGGHDVQWMPAHDAAEGFPQQIKGLQDTDVLVLSDIGANTLLLHPDTWLRGKPTPNRLSLIRDWTHAGGALVMCGGYFSFQGFNAGAFYAGSPVEEALPVSISRFDDRVEVPEGVNPQLTDSSHPVVAGVSGDWPVLLGYNRVEAKGSATVLANVNGDPFLVVGGHGQGKTLVWTSDIGPHWCPEEFASWEGFHRIWNQAISWLTS